MNILIDDGDKKVGILRAVTIRIYIVTHAHPADEISLEKKISTVTLVFDGLKARVPY
jgi:hypothetical protein